MFLKVYQTEFSINVRNNYVNHSWNFVVYVQFMDLKKAFDRMQHVKLMEDLVNIDLHNNDIKFINNIYCNQLIVVPGKVLYSQKHFTRCFLKPSSRKYYGIEKIGYNLVAKKINTLRFTDEAVILTETIAITHDFCS